MAQGCHKYLNVARELATIKSVLLNSTLKKTIPTRPPVLYRLTLVVSGEISHSLKLVTDFRRKQLVSTGIAQVVV